MGNNATIVIVVSKGITPNFQAAKIRTNTITAKNISTWTKDTTYSVGAIDSEINDDLEGLENMRGYLYNCVENMEKLWPTLPILTAALSPSGTEVRICEDTSTNSCYDNDWDSIHTLSQERELWDALGVICIAPLCDYKN